MTQGGPTQGTVPSWRHYAVGAAFIFAGVAVAIVFAVLWTIDLVKQIVPDIRVVAPGTHEVYLPHEGKYIVFYEYRSIVGDKVFLSSEAVPAMTVTMKPAKKDQPLPLSGPPMTLSYQLAGRAGDAILQFEVVDPGAHILTAVYSSGVTGPDFVLGVGQISLEWRALMWRVGGSLVAGVMFGGFIIARAAIKRRTLEQVRGGTPPPVYS